MNKPTPIDLPSFIAKNKATLTPPVSGKLMWPESQNYMVVLLGSNGRKDWHTNQTEELFYQIKGDMTLPVRIDGKLDMITIRENELFLLPANIPHSPQRPADTIGIVIERMRDKHHEDRLEWYCDSCDALLFGRQAHVSGNLVKFIDQVTEEYVSDVSHRTCSKCNHVSEL